MKLTATFGASRRPVLKIQRELCHAQMRPKRFRTWEMGSWSGLELWPLQCCCYFSSCFFINILLCGADHIKRMWADQVWGKTTWCHSTGWAIRLTGSWLLCSRSHVSPWIMALQRPGFKCYSLTFDKTFGTKKAIATNHIVPLSQCWNYLKTYSNYNVCRVKDFQVSICGGSNVIFAFNVNTSPKTFCLNFHKFATLLTYLHTKLICIYCTSCIQVEWNSDRWNSHNHRKLRYIKLFKQ